MTRHLLTKTGGQHNRGPKGRLKNPFARAFQGAAGESEERNEKTDDPPLITSREVFAKQRSPALAHAINLLCAAESRAR